LAAASARPVASRPQRAAGLIWIIDALRSAKEHEIDARTTSG